LLLSAVLALCLALVPPASAGAAQKGLETDLTWGLDAQDTSQTLTGVQDLGPGWTRITAAWHDIETSPGHYNSTQMSRLDTAIDGLQSTGSKVIVTVYTAPQWASGMSERESPPQNPADYARFIRAMAERYRGKVGAWEIWNEENFQQFWSSGPNAAKYAELLKAAYPAVKAGDPNATVVFGGLSLNDYAYLESAYAAEPNLGDYYDVMATHPYTFPASPPEQGWSDSKGRIAKASFPAYREVRRTMLDHGDDKPLWFTEFGWSTTTTGWGVTAAQQADYLTRAYRCLEQDPYVQVAIWYIFRNRTSDADTWVDQLGLTRWDFSHKVAYDAFKGYQQGNQGCQYTGLPNPKPALAPAPSPATDSGTSQPIPSGSAPSTKASPRVRVRIRLGVRSRASSRSKGRRGVPVSGRVVGARGGRVVLRLERRTGHGWRRSRGYRLRLRRGGAFACSIKRLRAGGWRVRAYFVAPDHRSVRSRLVYFSV